MKVNFLLAEEVRPEANNKISVLGLFAGDIVIMIKGVRAAAANFLHEQIAGADETFFVGQRDGHAAAGRRERGFQTG